MTAICGGGASGPKPGIPEVLALGGTAAGQLLSKFGLGWAVAAAVVVPMITENALDFCSTDPPADPGFNALDAVAILNLTDPVAFATAVGKLTDLIRIFMWYEFCQCSAVTTPQPPPALVIPPPNYPTTPGPTQGACHVASWEGPGLNSSAPGTAYQDRWITSTVVPPYGDTTILYGTSGVAVPARRVGIAQWSRYKIELKRLGSEPVYQQSVRVIWGDETGAQLNTGDALLFVDSFPGSDPPDYNSQTSNVPAGATRLAVATARHGSNPTQDYAVILTGYCQGTTVGAPTTYCPPDPAVRAMLDQILSMVTLIQRQHVPFASIPGETYSGLTGEGTITLGFPCLAIRVDLTTIPSYLGYQENNPDRLFDAGWITPGTSDSWEPQVRVTSDPFVWRVQGDVTRVGYRFPPGVVASITERRREF